MTNQPTLTSEQKRRYQLAGVAEAWLPWPTKFPREMAVIESELVGDEEVDCVFHAFLGRWTLFRSGLLFVTNRRLIFIQPAWFRRRVTSIAFDDIRRAAAKEIGRYLHVEIETTLGATFYFSRGVQDRERFSQLIKALQEKLGGRLIRDDPS